MRIPALDLGKQKTAAFLLDRDRDEQRHTNVKTTLAALHDLIVAMSPHRVVFEICPIVGWLSDLVRAMDVDLQVVNVHTGTPRSSQRRRVAAVHRLGFQRQTTPDCNQGRTAPYTGRGGMRAGSGVAAEEFGLR
jgi:hypothetical protein